MKKLLTFRKDKVRRNMTWKARKRRKLVPLKDKNDYQSCDICKENQSDPH